MQTNEDRAAVDLRRCALAAAGFTLLASALASSHGLLLNYADTRAHLTIARRLVDGPNRGLVQLGTVWLPLQHLVLAPLTLLDPLWRTGWAGALLGAACMAIEVAALWYIATTLNRGARLAGLLAAVVYATNPTVLYLHTSAFTEPVLYASVLTATAGLVHWATRERPLSGGEMALFCGTPAAMAVLARYDGWAFALAGAACVALIAWRRWGSVRFAAKMTTCFAAPPVVAALWWMWFNWINFGDPLEFQRGRYSAQAQQDVLARRGELPDKGSLAHSIETFSRAMWSSVGWLTLVAAVAGLVVVLVRVGRGRGSAAGPRRVLLLVAVLLIATPAAFYVWSLVSGQIALRLTTTALQSTFNLRYGAAVVPGLAVLVATGLAALGDRPRWRQAGVVALALCPFVALAIVPGWREVGVIREGLEQREAGADQWAAAQWLHRNADGGTVMIDDSVHPMLPVIGVGLDHVIAPFSSGWKAALRDPERATWIYVDRANRDDEIRRAIARDPGFLDDFDAAATFGDVTVYRTTRKEQP